MAGPAATGSVVAHSEKPTRVRFCAFGESHGRMEGGLVIAFLPSSAARRTES